MTRFFLCLLFLIVTGQLGAQPTPAISELLIKAEQAGLNANYISSFIHFHDGQLDSIKFVHANIEGQRKFRLSYLNGPSREVFHDGTSAVGFNDDGRPFLLNEADLDTPLHKGLLTAILRLSDHFEFSMLPNERVAGRLAKVLMATSNDGFRYSYRLWIDNQSLVLLRSDVIDETGKILEQFMTIEFQLLDQVPEQLQVMPVFSIPKQNSLTANNQKPAQVPWRVSWVPDGFSLKVREKFSWQENVSHMIYFDGITAISVYITPSATAKSQSPITMMRHGGTTMYDEIFDKFHVTVVGDIPQRTAVRIARSVMLTH